MAGNPSPDENSGTAGDVRNARHRPSVPNSDHRGWRSRGYLPHLDGVGLIQHVVFHLADSLPREVVDRLDRGYENSPPDRREEARRERIDAWLDAGHGSCTLREFELANLVQESLLSFQGERYRLSAWVIMPNHVHVLLCMLDEWTIAKTVMSWKSYTGRRISAWMALKKNARLEPGVPNDGANRVWHREYWDRYMRDEDHLRQTIEYIEQNPVKAGLVTECGAWPWSSAHPANAALLGRTT